DLLEGHGLAAREHGDAVAFAGEPVCQFTGGGLGLVVVGDQARDDQAGGAVAADEDRARRVGIGGDGADALVTPQCGGDLTCRATRALARDALGIADGEDQKSTRLNSSHVKISYAVFCLKKKKNSQATSPS